VLIGIVALALMLWERYSRERVKIENAATLTVVDSLKAIEGEPVHK